MSEDLKSRLHDWLDSNVISLIKHAYLNNQEVEDKYMNYPLPDFLFVICIMQSDGSYLSVYIEIPVRPNSQLYVTDLNQYRKYIGYTLDNPLDEYQAYLYISVMLNPNDLSLYTGAGYQRMNAGMAAGTIDDKDRHSYYLQNDLYYYYFNKDLCYKNGSVFKKANSTLDISNTDWGTVPDIEHISGSCTHSYPYGRQHYTYHKCFCGQYMDIVYEPLIYPWLNSVAINTLDTTTAVFNIDLVPGITRDILVNVPANKSDWNPDYPCDCSDTWAFMYPDMWKYTLENNVLTIQHEFCEHIVFQEDISDLLKEPEIKPQEPITQRPITDHNIPNDYVHVKQIKSQTTKRSKIM